MSAILAVYWPIKTRANGKCLQLVCFTRINVASQRWFYDNPRSQWMCGCQGVTKCQTDDSSEMILMNSNDFPGFVFNQPQSKQGPSEGCGSFFIIVTVAYNGCVWQIKWEVVSPWAWQKCCLKSANFIFRLCASIWPLTFITDSMSLEGQFYPLRKLSSAFCNIDFSYTPQEQWHSLNLKGIPWKNTLSKWNCFSWKSITCKYSESKCA